MQSLCTFTTSSDTFCTAVNEKNANTTGRLGGWSWGMWGGCGREERGRRSEVEGSKEKKKMGRGAGMKREGVKG